MLDISSSKIVPELLGSTQYRKDYGIKYAYHCGGMYRGIASKELVICLGKAGLLGFLGTAGMPFQQISRDIDFIQKSLLPQQAYGMNLICHFDNPEAEMQLVEMYLQKGVSCIEASAFMTVTKSLVYYRLKGLGKSDSGELVIKNNIIAKISRPETAAQFMSPAPEGLVRELLEEKRITLDEASLSAFCPMCDDVTVEADSGGHTDQGVAMVILPTIQRLRDQIMGEQRYAKQIRVGLAGGLGTPEAIASAFVMGADFVSTGSINQCTVESGISDTVKDILQSINIQDTDYAPAGDMFEIGARIQVLKKGVFFPARANKLYLLYSHYNSLEELPSSIKKQLETRYFKKSFDEIFEQTTQYFTSIGRASEIERAHNDGKHKMALVFRWYFGHTMRAAFEGDPKNQVDFQVHTGPALGAFNQWAKGTPLEDWHNRHVDEIANRLMQEAARLLRCRYDDFLSGSVAVSHPKGSCDE